MKQRRDANGKFVKMYPTREEYEAKIAKLSEECESWFRQAQKESKWCGEWKKSYESEVEKVHRLEHLVCIFSKSMLWLYDRVPFWTKKKFRSYYEGLLESNSNLKDVSERMKKFI
jgi:hypothetical protein